jgi:two-component system sensor histidine kinase SenX3
MMRSVQQEARRRRRIIAGAFVVVGALLAVLGTLQIKWLDQLYDGLSEARHTTIRGKGSAFVRAFDREISRAYEWFLLGPKRIEDGLAEDVLNRWRSWRRAGRHVALVREVYIVDRPLDPDARLFRVELSDNTLHPVSWPESLSSLRGGFHEASRSFMPNAGLVRRAGREIVLQLPPGSRLPSTPMLAPIPAGVLVVLDRSYIERTLLPSLAESCLGGVTSGLGARASEAPGAAPFFSWPAGIDAEAKGEQPFTILMARAFLVDAVAMAGVSPPNRDHRGLPRHYREIPPGSPAAEGALEHEFEKDPGLWSLSIGYASGPVDAFVAKVKRRDLAIGFAILVLLAGSVGAFGLAVIRATALAERQREFVAGVSHELRTPLAVIASAAENLRDGAVEDPARVRYYGAFVHAQTKRLVGTIDGILALAAGNAARAERRREAVDVRRTVDEALDRLQPEIRRRGVTVDYTAHELLPAVEGDPEAFRQAVENLIGNALKYGGVAAWLGVDLRAETEGDRPEVLISVEDQGIGIQPNELSQIFEPFFRGRDALEQQLPGSGIGLSLVRRIIELYGGRITVKSNPGSGSRFTLHLPIAPQPKPSDPELHQ